MWLRIKAAIDWIITKLAFKIINMLKVVALHLLSSLVLASFHSLTYFINGYDVLTYHLFHFLAPFAFLALLALFGRISIPKQLPCAVRDLRTLIALQCFISLSASMLDHETDFALYSVHVLDFVATFVVLYNWKGEMSVNRKVIVSLEFVCTPYL